MKDLLTSMINATKDRLSSALFFNFLFAWIIFNWKIAVAILFIGNDSLKDGLIYFIETNSTSPSRMFWYPFILAFIMSLLLPLLNALVDFVKRYIKKRKENYVLQLIHKRHPPNWEEFLALKEKENESSIKINQLDSEINTLKFDKGQLEEIAKKDKVIVSRMGDYMLTEITLCKSDINSYFVISKSETRPAKVITNGPIDNWNGNLLKYNYHLEGAYWISGEYPLPKQEAIEGGAYTLEKTFKISEPLGYFKSITLYCLVDNYLELKVNGQTVKNRQGKERSAGFDDLIEIDILERCIRAENKLQFAITNYNIEDSSKITDQEFAIGNVNPYGIVFKVIGLIDRDKVLLGE